jgi:hypothetical protein
MATNEAEDKDQDKLADAEADEEAEADADEEPNEAADEEPVVKADLGAYQLTYHKPVLTLASGEVVKCGHHWGHEGEPAAKACLRKLAADAGVKLPS